MLYTIVCVCEEEEGLRGRGDLWGDFICVCNCIFICICIFIFICICIWGWEAGIRAGAATLGDLQPQICRPRAQERFSYFSCCWMEVVMDSRCHLAILEPSHLAWGPRALFSGGHLGAIWSSWILPSAGHQRLKCHPRAPEMCFLPMLGFVVFCIFVSCISTKVSSVSTLVANWKLLS